MARNRAYVPRHARPKPRRTLTPLRTLAETIAVLVPTALMAAFIMVTTG